MATATEESDYALLKLPGTSYSTKSRIDDLERGHYGTVRFFDRWVKALVGELAEKQQTITRLTGRVDTMEAELAEKHQTIIRLTGRVDTMEAEMAAIYERIAKRVMFLEADLRTLRDPAIEGCVLEQIPDDA